MTRHIDCACVIHGNLYPWIYVVNLYNMLCRNLRYPVRFHVFTEPERPVPAPWIRHDLVTWPGIEGHKKAWWYKMQMFDPRHSVADLLYFDLDVLILQDITWIAELDLQYFWTLRDFKYLFRPSWQGVNTSVMRWNLDQFATVWQDFQQRGIQSVAKQWRGDQDYITDTVGATRTRFIDSDKVASWRWQIKDGGMDFRTRNYLRPNSGSVIPPNTNIAVFHGRPKPHEISDAVVQSAWK